MPDKIFSSIYMEEGLKARLRKLAEKENRSLNNYINTILLNHANKKMKTKPTLVKKDKLILKRRSA